VQRPQLVRASLRDAGVRAAAGLRMVVLVTVGLSAAMIFAAPALCVGIFGSGFRPSVPELQILVAGSLGIVALKQLGNALTAQRRRARLRLHRRPPRPSGGRPRAAPTPSASSRWPSCCGASSEGPYAERVLRARAGQPRRPPQGRAAQVPPAGAAALQLGDV